MRILHTADWHLNDRLGPIDRTEDLRRRVERIAALCEEHAADVLLVAGDVFAEQATADQVSGSLVHLRETFGAFFARGGTALAITGNHDQDRRVHRMLQVARAGMLVAAGPEEPGGRFRPGRLHLADSGFVGRVRDEREGFDVQFALLPYPSPSRLLDDDGGGFALAEEVHRRVRQAAAAWLRGLPDQPGFDPSLRSVLMAHLSVEGADVGRGLFRLRAEDDVALEADALPTGFDYVALGHVHKPQALGGRSHVRYSGSLDRLDFGEVDEPKGVVLVEVGPEGRRGEPRFVAIEPTPLEDVVILDPETTADDLRSRVPDAARSIVRVRVTPTAVVAAGEALDRAIRSAFPRVASVEWEEPATADGAEGRALRAQADFPATVLDYLKARVPEDDPQRDELLDLARRYLDREVRS